METEQQLREMDGKTGQGEYMELCGTMLSKQDFENWVAQGMVTKRVAKSGYRTTHVETYTYKFQHNRFGQPAVYKTNITWRKI